QERTSTRRGCHFPLELHDLRCEQEFADLLNALGLEGKASGGDNIGLRRKLRNQPLDPNLMLSTAPGAISNDHPFLVGRGQYDERPRRKSQRPQSMPDRGVTAGALRARHLHPPLDPNAIPVQNLDSFSEGSTSEPVRNTGDQVFAAIAIPIRLNLEGEPGIRVFERRW